MLKKIPVHQLCSGMYVHTICGSWLSHDFWRTSFLIDSAAVLDKLQSGAIEEVWIDTSRGVDVPTPASPPPPPAPSMLVAPASSTAPSVLAQELERATALCAASSHAVMDMFNEARMGHAVNVVSGIQLVHDITESVQRHPTALISVARLKTADNYTFMHSVAVSGLMVALARTLGHTPEQVHQAGMAGLLHDIGKARTRPEVLNKPGKLTDEEFEHMKQHPVDSHALLQGSVDDLLVLDACLHHHERMDGMGYPHGLDRTQISVLSRMTSICDVYDAITSDRPYKQGWSPSVALERMSAWTGDHLDADIFEAFVKTIGIYPLGSLVRLQSGLLGVVCAPAEKSLSAPRIMAFYHVPQQRMLRPARLLDLAKYPQERIIAREDPADWPFENLDSLWQRAAAALPA